ncbi:DUF4810 domain-containing protein [Cupriavidus basilensis]
MRGIPSPCTSGRAIRSRSTSTSRASQRPAKVTALEAGLEKIKAKGGSVPPGYHAQLGMLYLNIGKGDQMIKEFQTEKTLFPEATPYMDFLLRNVKGDARKQTTVGSAVEDKNTTAAGSTK